MCALQYVVLVFFLLSLMIQFFSTQQHRLRQQSSQHMCTSHSEVFKKYLQRSTQFVLEGLFFLTLCPPVKDDREYLGGGANIC